MVVTTKAWIVAASAIAALLVGVSSLHGQAAAPEAPAAKEVPVAKEATPASADRIVGEWTSNPFDSPVGPATQIFCFGEDGAVVIHSETRAGARDAKGTYRLEAGKLSLTWSEPAATSTLRVTWSGDNFVLADGSGEGRTYRRTSSSCAAP